MEVENYLSPKALLRAIKVLVHGRLSALPSCGNGPRQISVVVVRVQGGSRPSLRRHWLPRVVEAVALQLPTSSLSSTDCPVDIFCRCNSTLPTVVVATLRLPMLLSLSVSAVVLAIVSS